MVGVRTLWLKFFLLMALMGTFQAGGTVLSSKQLHNLHFAGTAMDYVSFGRMLACTWRACSQHQALLQAGQRRYLLNKMTTTVQEMLIGDDQLAATANLTIQLGDDRAWFQRLHRGLLYGDIELHVEAYTTRVRVVAARTVWGCLLLLLPLLLLLLVCLVRPFGGREVTLFVWCSVAGVGRFVVWSHPRRVFHQREHHCRPSCIRR